jgi:hypothetical protein
MRKQQNLLRVIKRHALADRDYYLRHRRRIDRALAHLHRAVAVPMLLQRGTTHTRRRSAAAARLYIARCARYGRPAWMLHLASLVPSPWCGVAVKAVESIRQVSRSISSYLSSAGGRYSALAWRQ